jgi:hypothetical protein
MVSPTPHHAAPHPSDDDEATEAVEELIAEFGVRGLVSACLKSSAGDEFGRVGSNSTLRIAQVILREIAFSRDPRLEAEIMALGAGLILAEKDNITRIAEKHGLTKQAISKRVIKFCDDNGLPPSIYMRTKKDRETYAKTNQPRAY